MFYSFNGCDAFCIFSMKINGNMKGEDGRLNREVFFEKYLPKSVKKIVMAEQVHGNSVEVVGMNSPEIITGVDGLVTSERGVALGTFGADCRNVPMCDQDFGVIGNVHLGYRGILQKAAHNTVAKMIGLGAEKERIKPIIGQGVCGRCFEFDKKDAGIFKQYWPFVSQKEDSGGKVFVDLFGIVFYQLTKEIGIPAANIQYIDVCTKENANFFSQRRDKKDPIESGIAIIGLR